jgi:hypothetical protein
MKPTTRSRHSLPARALVAAASGLALGGLATEAHAQEPTVHDLMRRIEAQDRRIQSLEAEQGQAARGAGVEVGYKKGYYLRSTDPNSPFELRINGRMQFRYTGFDADRGGRTSENPTYRNDFEIERARLEFRGTFIDSDTHFYLNLDGDTDDNHTVIAHDFWVNHEFGRGFDLYMGKAFFPGSREWLDGSTRTHFVDRSMSGSFFRPDRSLGIWAIGEPIDGVHYRVMVANGINTTDLESDQIDNKFAYGGSVWWDPLADYGSGYADLEHHEDLAVRVGASVTYADEEDGQASDNREADTIRLSDGTRLTALGAESFDIYLGAVDAAMKYRGFSAHGEAFYRDIDDIWAPSNPSLRRGFYSWGGYCDVGYMIVPKRFEVVGRVSTVQGRIKDSWEYAAGLNWYVQGSHENKLSFDVTKLDGSPTDSSGPNYRVNDDGWMFRLQYQIAF